MSKMSTYIRGHVQVEKLARKLQSESHVRICRPERMSPGRCAHRVPYEKAEFLERHWQRLKENLRPKEDGLENQP